MRLLLLLILSSFCCVQMNAQVTVRGVVEDSATHERLVGASVSYQRKSRTLKFARTDQWGQFAIQMDQVEKDDQLQVTMMGYDKRRYDVPMDPIHLMTIILPSRAFELKEVKVQGSRVTGRDTVTFDLPRFVTERDNSLKDVLKKLPGVDVAKNGTIAYNGRKISRFTVEGLDLTGGRYNQLTENIRAKDVKKAEIVEHDQPIKALEKTVMTDNVGMNVTLKDEARDKLMATLRPYLLFDDPTHVAGSANIRQIGKKRQRMYDVAYDRKGQDISESYNILGFNWNRLDAATLPSWYTSPTLSSPIDADLLRFNTSQRYGINQLTKTKDDNELRISASYSRSVERQHTQNTSLYYLNGDKPIITTEDKHQTLKNDHFVAELEHKTNKEEQYGNEILKIQASQKDGLTELSGTSRQLSQQVRMPQVDISGSLYRLYPLRHAGDQLTWKSVLDCHHSVNDLYIDDERSRLRTNLWHTRHLLNYTRKRGLWTQEYEGGIAAENTHTEDDNWQLSTFVNPSWQFKTEDFRLTLRPKAELEHFARQHQSMLLLSPSVNLNWQPSSRHELRASTSYSESTGSVRDYGLDEYRRDYRTWYVSSGIIPQTSRLSAWLGYHYKRPIRELFFNASLSAGRTWSNTSTDMRIVDGNYYYSLKEMHSHSDVLSGELSGSKGFHDLHLKTSLSAEGSLSKGQQLSSDHWIDYTSRSLSLKPMINFAPSWCEVEYQGSFFFYGNKAFGQAMSTLFNWEQQLTLTSTINKVDLSWSFIHYRNELQAGNVMNTMLSNASVTWRLKKVQLKAWLRNLFNKKDYVVTTYNGIATTTNSYVLRPREFVVSAEFSI